MGLHLLTDLFTVCFWFGATTTLVSFVLGLGRHGPFHAPHAGHGPYVGHGPVLGHHGGPEVSPLNLTSILAFLLVFGAVGLVLPAGLETRVRAIVLEDIDLSTSSPAWAVLGSNQRPWD